MNELTIVKRDGNSYIDSRQVAELIGKNHKNLLRDIREYAEILARRGRLIFEPTSFFVESSFVDKWNRSQPCYLISRRGADVIANKLTGEKGVLFTAAYVTKFHEMAERERNDEIEQIKAQAVTPRLTVFNTAVKSVLSGMNQANASTEVIMSFLRGAYKPFGITVSEVGDDDRYFSATAIARILKMYSHSGRPHAQAVCAVIEDLGAEVMEHIEITPYGLVGFSVRYDRYVAAGVAEWIVLHGNPNNIPHNGKSYHVWYGEPPVQMTLDDVIALDDDEDDDYVLTDEDIDEMCGKMGECDECPYFADCVGTPIR